MIVFDKMKAAIWDWNGTLLNDLAPCIASMNRMLKKRNYPLLSETRYKEIFTFPVRSYYQEAGLDLSVHNWDEVAHEFINLYRRQVAACKLTVDALLVIEGLQAAGIRQFILSAMQQDFLLETVKQRMSPGLFERIAGLDNHYAHTKEEVGKKLMAEIGLPAHEVLMVGDTLHDYEVAQALGINCLLFSGGHQSRHRLEKTGVQVISGLEDILKLLGVGNLE